MVAGKEREVARRTHVLGGPQRDATPSMSASGPRAFPGSCMAYSRVTNLFAYDWKVAESPVRRVTALFAAAHWGPSR